MENRREKLLMQPKSGYDRLQEGGWSAVTDYCKGYKAFLDAGKTEYAFVREAIKKADGFTEYKPGQAIKPGSRLFVQNHGKTAIFAVVGQKPLSEGLRIVATHIDCPRIDLKAYPMYEDGDMLLFKTHYYGGIRKYHWLARPLSLIGVVYRADGTKIDICIGEDEGDPVLCITDLLPHLAADQAKKVLSEAFPGESLNPVAGLNPDAEEGSDRIKLAVLTLLHEKYSITEADFQSAELSLVPSGKARDVGFDRALIGAYGHDDRSCSYAALKAICETQNPLYTSVCVLADKEEIGSEGITGMQSAFFDSFIEDLCAAQSVSLGHCYRNSLCFSGDVCNAFDPNFPEVSDKRNNAKAGYGMAICKYTGRGGKGGSSDASAQTVSRVRTLLDAAGVMWQMSELGKVDQGGGGTVACELARRNIEVVDTGVPVLSMHAPFELVSKLDCYMTYKAFEALYNDK